MLRGFFLSILNKVCKYIQLFWFSFFYPYITIKSVFDVKKFCLLTLNNTHYKSFYIYFFFRGYNHTLYFSSTYVMISKCITISYISNRFIVYLVLYGNLSLKDWFQNVVDFSSGTLWKTHLKYSIFEEVCWTLYNTILIKV